MQEQDQSFGIDPKKYYSVTQAAKALGVHRSTLWRWVKDFKIRVRTRVVNNRSEIIGSELLKLLKHR